MTFATHPRALRIMAAGAVALGALFVAGAVVQVPRIEDDLSAQVESKLAAAGIAASADFSGQDGMLRCVEPLADPDRAVSLASSVWGVRTVELDVSCGVPGAPVSTTTSSSTPATSTTVGATTTVPATTVAPTTDPTTTDPSTTDPTTTLPAEPNLVTVTLQDGRFALDGAVASDLERFVLVDRAGAALSPSNVTNNLTIDEQVPSLPAGLFDVLSLMPTTLVSGELGWNGTTVGLTGSYASEEGRATIADASGEAGVVATLAPRAAATAEQGAALEGELNALVAAQPILFDKGSVDISLSSLGTVQQVAGIAKRYSGLLIEVQGHTDSEGDPDLNMALSQQRAGAVRDALISMGVPVGDLTSKGFGMTELIRDSNGNEVPDKSRRVVFGVTPI